MEPGVKSVESKVEKVGAVTDGSLPDVGPGRSDIDTAGNDDGGKRSGRRPKLLRRARQTSPATGVQGGSVRKRRHPGIGIFNALRRAWIPLVILLVIVAGAVTVSKLRDVFTSDKPLTYADSRHEETTPFNPKHMRYEIFGPPGTVADISYFDVNANPVHVAGVRLPWSLDFPITAAAGVGSVAAEGDSDRLGCRILVDGVVKDNKTATHEVSTFVSCALKAA
jgi:Mycobacterium membrane protein